MCSYVAIIAQPYVRVEYFRNHTRPHSQESRLTVWHTTDTWPKNTRPLPDKCWSLQHHSRIPLLPFPSLPPNNQPLWTELTMTYWERSWRLELLKPKHNVENPHLPNMQPKQGGRQLMEVNGRVDKMHEFVAISTPEPSLVSEIKNLTVLMSVIVCCNWLVSWELDGCESLLSKLFFF